MRQSKSSCDGWYCSCDLFGLSNSLGAKNSRVTFFHKLPRDPRFVFENHVNATLLPIHLQIPLARVLSECLQSVLNC
jgi:hypothetical protein